MIIGLGIDIVDINRLKRSYERFGRSFSDRILHSEELKNLPHNPEQIPTFLASRFAAKEAAVKALGTGFSQDIHLQDIEVKKESNGAPLLILHNQAKKRFDELGATNSFISISHEKTMCVVVVILEK
ncbi:holo-ACP synthase [Desulfovibrio litoralis]|uniref:Holo-[acyl-carrier-protein] synthase n=1 Tax=Desulfovibrio litoralis DSM 11393 TaxID=1121455 RepID=A0A1M7T908_9BACT|nr:holo-ACP synthase [Desulfovibrio litoralis]SHN67229.1 holo-[acyl-carrier protein] synthase [Desulfovibrio litoralis DSM 11393]